MDPTKADKTVAKMAACWAEKRVDTKAVMRAATMVGRKVA